MPKRRGRGEGSIFRQADGIWVGQLELEPTAAGTRRRRRIYGRTRRQVLEKLDRLKADLGMGYEPLSVGQQRTTIGELAGEWLDQLDRSGTLRPLSRVRTGVVIAHQVLPYLAQLPAMRLDADRIERWQGQLLQAGCAPRTVWKARSALAALIRLARRKRPPLLRDNPLELVDSPPAEQPSKRALSTDEARRLLRALAGHRLEPLLLVMLALGLRRGEVLGLTWADVDFEARTLSVRQQVQRVPNVAGLQLAAPKSRAGTRVLPLSSLLVDQLLILRERRISPFVFCSDVGTPMEPRNLSRAFELLVRSAGLDHITLHELRHSASTILLVMGVPPMVVAQLLGHSDPTVTLRSYGHVVPEAHRQAVEHMDAYLRALLEADGAR